MYSFISNGDFKKGWIIDLYFIRAPFSVWDRQYIENRGRDCLQNACFKQRSEFNNHFCGIVMRQRLYRAQWGKCKEVEVLVTVNGLFSVMWLEEPQRFGVFCLSIMLSPTPFSPSPNNWTPCCTPHDPSGSPRLYQWALYIRIPSQRQEPPALVKSFPLTVIMRNTNHMLDTKWFHIIELPNKKSK